MNADGLQYYDQPGNMHQQLFDGWHKHPIHDSGPLPLLPCPCDAGHLVGWPQGLVGRTCQAIHKS